MAAFGKADTGLIKATAGAEAGQHIDQNLMIGSAISGALTSIQKQQDARNAQAAAAQKELEGKFKSISGNPDAQMLDYIGGVTPAYTSQYSKLKGGGFFSKQQQQFILDDYNGQIEQVENFTVGINLLKESGEYGPGASPNDKKYGSQLALGNYKVEGHKDPVTGYTQLNALVDNHGMTLNSEGNPVESETLINLRNKQIELQGNNQELDETDLTNLNQLEEQFKKDQKNYNDWKNLPHYLNDDPRQGPNPDKYQIYNTDNLPRKGESDVNNTNMLNVYNTNISNVKEGAGLKNIVTEGSYAGQVEAAMVKKGSDQSGRAFQDYIFGDFSEDNIDNSFASIFTKGADVTKHPEMYNNLDGNPIEWNLASLGLSKEEIAAIEGVAGGIKDGKLIHGSTEWDAIEANAPGTQGTLLENFLRGVNSDGSSDSDQRKEWIKKRYPQFMGVVLKESFTNKQKSVYEPKGQYFNSNDGTSPVLETKDMQYNKKTETYTNSLVESAFPNAFIENGKLSPDKLDVVAKGLGTLFNEHHEGNVVGVSTKGGKLIIKLSDQNKTREFDFKEGDYSTTMNALKQFLKGATLNHDIIDGLSNDTNGSKWQDIPDNKYILYPNLITRPQSPIDPNQPVTYTTT